MSVVKSTIDKYWNTLDNDMKIMVTFSALKCNPVKLASSFSWACQVMAIRELDKLPNQKDREYQEELVKQSIILNFDPNEKNS